MIDEQVSQKLRLRYPEIHPLLFQRSLERAKSNGELFDILDTMPQELPIVWDEELSRWVTTDDLLQQNEMRIGE